MPVFYNITQYKYIYYFAYIRSPKSFYRQITIIILGTVPFSGSASVTARI